MIEISVSDIAIAVGGTIIHGPKDATVNRISLDTRTLKPGSIFIPLKGKKFDGHDYLYEAAMKGARAVLVERYGQNDCKDMTIISVGNTLKALHCLARWYRNKFEVDFVAVTGSTGKTTTKNIIAAVLSTQHRVLKTPGNYNNQIGLPVTIMALDDSHRLGVTEMGMSGYGEIKRLMEIVRPKVSVVTNIGMSHIEALGSRQGILKAKTEIFEGMAKDPIAVINADDDLIMSAGKGLNMPIIYYGINKGDYKALDISPKGERGVRYTLSAEGQRFEVILPLPGIHNVSNSLAAVAVARVFGIEFDDIIKAIGNLKGEKMRLAIHDTHKGAKVINDAYNASPESMKAALRVLRDMPAKRRIAVLSDMLEMGVYAEECHRAVGAFAADAGVDILITLGNNSRFIAKEAKKKGMSGSTVQHFDSKKEAAELLESLLKEGDVILFKGSRGMHMDELVDKVLERS